MRNLEIKVRCTGLDAVRDRAVELSARDAGILRATDTYFHVRHGRLKLRETEGGPLAQLIAYDRPDEASSRYSDYHITPIPDPAGLKLALGSTLGVLITVTKSRHLWLYGETRIHLDRIDGLGDFVELETVMRGQPEAAARAEHHMVKGALGLDRCDVVGSSYSDLILQGYI